jgi:hypothetical protein
MHIALDFNIMKKFLLGILASVIFAITIYSLIVIPFTHLVAGSGLAILWYLVFDMIKEELNGKR